MKNITARTLRTTLTCIALSAFLSTAASAGTDSSANYPSWTDGSNAGDGFTPWQFHSDNHGSGFAGLEKSTDSENMRASDGSVWKLYAVDFNAAAVGEQAWEEATAYRGFNTPLTKAGDTFALSFEHGGIANPGQVGFALRTGNAIGSGSRNSGARLQVYFEGGDNNLTVEDAGGPREIPGLGFTFDGYDTSLVLTGANTYSLSIERYNSGGGTKDAPVVISGTLAGAGQINSFSMFNWNYSAGTDGSNHDAYFNRLSYSTRIKGDFNNDGLANGIDIDLLFAAQAGQVPSAEARFDVNGDGQVVTTPGAVGSDVDAFVLVLKETAYGDANFDGKVSFTDLVALAQHYNQPGGWSDGSFNGDGNVGFADLVILAQNYNFGNTNTTAVGDAHFAADWARAQSLIPEPAMAAALGTAALILLRRRRDAAREGCSIIRPLL